jgi:hypothetical protein
MHSENDLTLDQVFFSISHHCELIETARTGNLEKIRYLVESDVYCDINASDIGHNKPTDDCCSAGACASCGILNQQRS